MAVTAEMENVKVVVSGADGPRLHVALAGRLNASTLTDAWTSTMGPAERATAKELRVDVSGLTYCDGAGLGLFAALRRVMSSRGGTMQFEGSRADQARLLDMSLLKDPLAKGLEHQKRAGAVTQLGHSVWDLVHGMRELVAFTGELMATLVWALFHPQQVRGRQTLAIAQKAGADALPVVALLGLLVGVILAFQTATPLQQLGAQPLIPTIVSIAVVREMGALITAIILAGRSGSAFAAEIGTMEVTEELNALKTLGINPMRFLVLPRVLAVMLVTPLLTAFNILMSLIGGYIVMAALGYSLNFYVDAVRAAVNYRDFLGGEFKSVVFAVIIGGIGCLRGMQTKSGPGAVGDSTTRAVVAGIVFTIVADAIMGVLYFYLGL
jgi:phospholipid/cholesterol/gamma-HCH transport system permease protein